MSKTNIALIGMMGSGKSFCARRLGELLKRTVVSTDEVIEHQEGRNIKAIFKGSGEAYFRKLEKALVQKVAQKKDIIIDCGGGIVIDPGNLAALKKSSTLFYLKASPEFLYEKVQLRKDRPLLEVVDPLGRIKELLASREAAYEKADYILETTGLTIEQICEKILNVLKS